MQLGTAYDTQFLQTISVNRHNVEENRIGVNENSRRVSVDCSGERTLGARLLNEVLILRLHLQLP
jgi:hypothetical protein